MLDTVEAPVAAQRAKLIGHYVARLDDKGLPREFLPANDRDHATFLAECMAYAKPGQKFALYTGYAYD